MKRKRQDDPDGDSCSVCQEPLGSETPLEKLSCHHVFHRKCLRPWLQRSRTCPLCRLPLRISEHAIRLILAAEQGDVPTVREILQKPTFVLDEDTARTAMHFAVQQETPELTFLLAQEGGADFGALASAGYVFRAEFPVIEAVRDCIPVQLYLPVVALHFMDRESCMLIHALRTSWEFAVAAPAEGKKEALLGTGLMLIRHSQVQGLRWIMTLPEFEPGTTWKMLALRAAVSIQARAPGRMLEFLIAWWGSDPPPCAAVLRGILRTAANNHRDDAMTWLVNYAPVTLSSEIPKVARLALVENWAAGLTWALGQQSDIWSVRILRSLFDMIFMLDATWGIEPLLHCAHGLAAVSLALSAWQPPASVAYRAAARAAIAAGLDLTALATQALNHVYKQISVPP